MRLLGKLCIIVMIYSCTQETVTPTFFGSVEGQVINSQTNEGVANALITTSPATNSILTNADGTFRLEDIPTAQYTITAESENFGTKSVSVSVEEGKVTTAQIVLQNQGVTSDILSARVTSWTETVFTDTTSMQDSVIVNVEFEVSNLSTTKNIDEYEVYFKIFTSEIEFFVEERDSSLAANEKDFDRFKRSIGNRKTDSVKVVGTWTPNM